MKTVLKIAGLVVVAVALLGAGLFVGTRVAEAQVLANPILSDPAQLIQQGPGDPGGPGGLGRHHGAGDGWMADYRDELHAAIASGLGMSVEDFNAALTAGKTPYEIAQDKGLTQAQFADVTLKAYKEVLALAVKDGKLTQAQADAILAHMQQRIEQGDVPGSGPHGGGCPQPAGTPAPTGSQG